MKRLHTILVRVLGIDESEIRDTLSTKDVEAWDSFNALMLVSELEQEFGVEFTTEEVVSVTCIQDIKDALRRHGVELYA